MIKSFACFKTILLFVCAAQIIGAERRPFGMNVPGIDNRQLALNIMHWLSSLLK
jgi:hypothetical protein